MNTTPASKPRKPTGRDLSIAYRRECPVRYEPNDGGASRRALRRNLAAVRGLEAGLRLIAGNPMGPLAPDVSALLNSAPRSHRRNPHRGQWHQAHANRDAGATGHKNYRDRRRKAVARAHRR